MGAWLCVAERVLLIQRLSEGRRASGKRRASDRKTEGPGDVVGGDRRSMLTSTYPSRIEGSLVWKPGDRQARPMSLAVRGAAGLAVRAPEEWTMLLEAERSRRRGR